MGKKRVITKGTSSQTPKTKTSSGKKKKAVKSVDSGRVYIKVSFNNTMVTITDQNGNVITWASAGSLGFSGPKKATPFAAQKVIATVAEKIAKTGPFNVDVIVTGVSVGRDSAIRSLINHGFNINSIKDATPVPHNGPKPKKVRRV
ncbi:MAG: 30S ribosomal protein S11 [Candidatus Colwellbacteria bacterium]|jgi:small subunit ribosomal protein S11|nr:30S ribosomal protein S11 [Candidatus Colwellbacteria bacterium]MCK9497596.1 30S ribosomal protein S11 [Candidatus Colwellbacteria bacterium]MDD3752406.1 30S ribosomal protein S11 [Candidatus Colwellbacteria bacterium]MDD4818811.1 30S ribosomal protein S11 [Candidatus Colwellbacteria bacterium]